MALYTSRALAEGDEGLFGLRLKVKWRLAPALWVFCPLKIKMTCSRWEGPMQSDGATCPSLTLISSEKRGNVSGRPGRRRLLDDPRRDLINEHRLQRRRFLAACSKCVLILSYVS